MKNKQQIIDRWNATIALVRDLSTDARLTGLASGYAELAAKEMEKISPDGICGSQVERLDPKAPGSEFYETLLFKVQKLRDETSKRCLGDCFLLDGTKLYGKEQGVALLAKYDELISTLKHQVEMAAVGSATLTP